LKTLGKLHSRGDISEAWVQAEFEQIQDANTFEHENEAKWYMELFRNKSSFHRLFMACAIHTSVQMTGVSAIQYYSVTVHGQIGISGTDTLKYLGISSVIALIAQFLCILLIDKTGRCWALIGGNLGNMVTFIIAVALLAKFPPGAADHAAASWGFIVITWLFNFFSPPLAALSLGSFLPKSSILGLDPRVSQSLSWSRSR
jgi:hypothetical protein